MAHFAKLDENNVVTNVITFSNDEVNASTLAWVSV